MEINHWVTQMKKALQEINGVQLLRFINTDEQMMEMIPIHFALSYAKDKLGEKLTDDMISDGKNPLEPDQVIGYVQKNKDIYREHLLPPDTMNTKMDEAFLTLPGFPALVEILEKTENVNRSNVSAVLVIASRRSDELKEAVEQIQLHFEQDANEVALFFKRYFEVVKGWKFNKMNRKESQGSVEVVNNMMEQLARSILLEEDADAIHAFREAAK